MFLRLAAVCLCLLPLLGCNKSGGNTATAGAPATLPAGWPVPGLALPSDALQHRLPKFQTTPAAGGGTETRHVYPAKGGTFTVTPQTSNMAPVGEWEVGFTTAWIWSEVIGPIESNLLSLGYDKLTEKQGSDTSTIVYCRAVFLSTDKKTMVNIIQTELPLDDGSGTTVAYQYMIWDMPIPIAQEKIENFKRTGSFSGR